MWSKTSHIGCDYTVCESDKYSEVLISCNYGPGGNFRRQAAFDEEAYEKINTLEETQQKYGGLPRCD